MFNPFEMQRRFKRGDGVDWIEMWYRGEIDEYTMFEKTGYRASDIAIVAVPRDQANSSTTVTL